MSRRKGPVPLQKVTLNLRLGDWEWMKTYHGHLRAGIIVRKMVADHVDRVGEEARRTLAELEKESH